MSQLEEIRKRLEAEEAFESSAEIGLNLLAALEEAERELRALDQVFGKDDDVIHAVITQVRQAITEALK